MSKTEISPEQKKRNEFVDHETYDLLDLLSMMGLKNPEVDINLSESQCMVCINYENSRQKVIAEKIRQIVRTDLGLYGIAGADNITVTVLDSGK